MTKMLFTCNVNLVDAGYEAVMYDGFTVYGLDRIEFRVNSECDVKGIVETMRDRADVFFAESEEPGFITVYYDGLDCDFEFWVDDVVEFFENAGVLVTGSGIENSEIKENDEFTQDDAVREVAMLFDLADEVYDTDRDSWEKFDESAQEHIAKYAKMFGVRYAEFEDWVIEYRMFGEGKCDFEG